MDPQLEAQLIADAAQTSVLLAQGLHANTKSGADRKTIATNFFLQFLALVLPAVPAVVAGLIANQRVAAGYAAAKSDGTLAQATAAAPQPDVQSTSADTAAAQ